MKTLSIVLSAVFTLSPMAVTAKQSESQRSDQRSPVSKTPPTSKQPANCSNLPRRCADIQNCADAQRALRCGMTRLDRDHDGVACDKQCQ